MIPRRPTCYLVSAIVSTYNAERFLRGRLEDLEAQTIADQLEIIVIDSGSQQNERAIVEEFQGRYRNIRYLRTERRETVYQAWNRGIREASGEFVTNANTDDRLRHDALETLVRALGEHPGCVLAYPDFRITQQENVTFAGHQPYGFKQWPPYDRLSLLELCCIGPFPLWRRSLHREIGYFDERYRSAADYEFWLRAALSHDFIHVPQFLGLYWLNGATVSRRGDLPTLEYLQVQKEYRAKFAHLAPAPVPLPPGELARFQALSERAAAAADPPLAELECFSTLHPGFPAAHHDLATLYYRKQEIGLARKHFEKAVLIDPRSQQFRDSLAGFLRLELYQSLQYHTEVAACGASLDSLLCAGIICILLERFEAARLHYRRALEIEPENAMARQNLAALSGSSSGEAASPEAAAPRPPSSKLTSIVMVTDGDLERIRESLESIARNTGEPHEVILVQGGSPEEVLRGLRDICAADGRYRLLEQGASPGWPAGCNLGMRQARGGRILLLTSGTLVTRGWLGGMLDCLEREAGAGIVAPMSNGVAELRQPDGAPSRDSQELEEFARGFRVANLGRRIAVPSVAGCCLLFTRDLLTEVGELDAGLGAPGPALDDFCLRAALAGFGCVLAGDVYLQHDAGTPARALAEDRSPFDAKWDLGRLDEALAKRVVTRNALVQGRRLARQGNLAGAVDLLLQQGIRFSPGSREPYRALAEILIDAGRFQDAGEVLAELPGAEDEASLLLAAQCASGQGRPAEAESLAGRALRINPESAGARQLLGVLACGRGESEAAEAHFRAGISADPGLGPCYTGLGRLLWDRGDRMAGLDLAELGFILAPLSMAALASFHDFATACDALPREEQRVREARAIFPEHQGLAFGLIDLLVRRALYREAMAEIERAAVDFGMADAMIDAALAIRGRLGPKAPQNGGRATLCLCMIVKDEARHLPAALGSLRSLVDEIVVVDTGSSDRSADIARVFGARLFDFPWTGSFSQARNFSLRQASCDWILVLDADEVLAASDLAALRALLDRAETAAYTFTTRNYTTEIAREGWSANAGHYPAEERGSGWTPSDKVRLIPNDARLQFQGAVHELLEPTLWASGIPIRPCPIPVHHYGKLDTEKSLRKQEQYYLLGLEKLSETGGDEASLAELARQATELQRFTEAEELWHKLLEARPDSAEAYFNLGYLHLAAADYPTARDHASRAVHLAPQMKEAAFNLAKCELFLGNSRAALNASQQMLRLWPDYPPALSLYSACCLVLGLNQEGEAAMARLSGRGFDCADYLREYATGLMKGERGDLAAPLLSLAARVAGDPQGALPARDGEQDGLHACC